MRDRSWRRKLILTALLLAALAATTIGPVRTLVFERHLFGAVDQAAKEVVDQAFGRALAAFALARTTNAVISVIQETEIHASPAGVGITLALGQALDPINDLVERFSWVMLVALTSLGIQKFLIEVSPWLSVQLLATLALLLWLTALWVGDALRLDFGLLARRLLLLALVVRFAVPVAAGLNHLVYENFLSEPYEHAAATVEQQTAELQKSDPTATFEPQEDAGTGWWQRLRQSLSRAEDALDFHRLLDWLQERADRLINGFLDLIVVFLLNTVLLPLAFLWGLFRLCRLLIAEPRINRLESAIRRRIVGDKLPHPNSPPPPPAS